MTKTYTLTEEELEELIAERMQKKKTSQSVFKDVSIDNELAPINLKYPKIVEKLSLGRAVNPERFAFNQVPDKRPSGEVSYHKVVPVDIHNHLRMLTLNVFGKSQNKELLQEEYDQATKVYKEFKELFVKKYAERLEKLEGGK